MKGGPARLQSLTELSNPRSALVSYHNAEHNAFFYAGS
jgi:hypothetical protein